MMKFFFTLLFCLTYLLFNGCSVKYKNSLIDLPKISLEDEEGEIFLQKKILINEMIAASRKLHQISWPILKNNIDICFQEGPYSFGILYATEQDLPEKDSKFYKKVLNNNISPSYLEIYDVSSLPVIVSVAKNSPAYKSKLLEGDVVLKINNLNTRKFRKKLSRAMMRTSKLKLAILRNNQVLEKEIIGEKICNYNIQAIPSPAPNAYADGEKVFITLAAIKLAKTNDELAFLIGHELAHNIYHYKYFNGSEANNLSINYLDTPKLKNLNSFFMYSSQSREIEADLKGVEIAFKGGYDLENVNDYWRRLSVFNPNMIASSSTIYKSNALRALMISKTLKKLKELNEYK